MRHGLAPALHEQAEAQVRDPLTFAAFLVRSGDCAGAVGGSLAATADVIRAGLQVVGLAESTRTVSSCFLMLLPDGRSLTYADCGVVPDPTPEQLADIASASAETHVRLVGDTPKVALLSFSSALPLRPLRLCGEGCQQVGTYFSE